MVIIMSHKKRTWRSEEDDALIQLIQEFGAQGWPQISDTLHQRFALNRSAKQCRDRWHYHLNPDVKQEEWSAEEESVLLTSQRILGNKWSEIARRLPGRTENSVKNHYYSKVRREKRLAQRPPNRDDLDLLPSPGLATTDPDCPTSRHAGDLQIDSLMPVESVLNSDDDLQDFEDLK